MTPIDRSGNPTGDGRYGGARSGLDRAAGTMRFTKLMLTGVGALMVVAGLVMAAKVNAGAGIGMLVGGVVIACVAWFVMPGLFGGQLRRATAMVNALQATEQLAVTGTPMAARVTAVQQTGTLINSNPEARVVLEVQGPQGPYEVQTTAVIPQLDIPRFQPGAMIRVRVNPHNPQDVAIVF